MKKHTIAINATCLMVLIPWLINTGNCQTCVSCPNSVITGQNASAIGNSATASGLEAIAIGQNSQASNVRSIAIGSNAKSQGMSSFAFGNFVNSNAPNSMTFGLGTTNTYLTNTIANSLIVGFNSNLPSLFVGSSDGAGTTGKVGIGTTTPSDKLSVNGIVQSISGGFRFPDGTLQETKAFSPWLQSNQNICFNSGSVGVGTASPIAKLDVFGDIVLGKPGDNFIIHSRSWIGDALIIAPQNGYSGWEWNKGITLKDNGQVYIGSEQIGGTLNADYKLAVNGKLVSREVVVTAQNWADYVLSGKYKLLSLDDLEQFICLNKHLPDVPTEMDVAASGIQMGVITTLLLKKIEELTLYVIEHKDRINTLERQIQCYTESETFKTEYYEK